jgi:3,5-epimerase/4-reductase
MSIILLGKNSFVAQHILASNKDILPYNKRFYNDTDIHSFVRELKAMNADVVINAIGATGSPNIDQLESDKEQTFFTNTMVPIGLANACNKFGIHFVQLSSGCCFYGQSPHQEFAGLDIDVANYPNHTGNVETHWTDAGWKETDHANPQSTYSCSKYAADLVLAKLDTSCILRLRMPVSTLNHPRNLLSKLISYKQVLETPNSITFLEDLTRAVQWVIDNKKTGIYHVASQKPITHSVLLDEFKKYKPDHEYTKITPDELNAITQAPRSNCILNVDKIQNEGFEFENTDVAVSRYVKQFALNKGLI